MNAPATTPASLPAAARYAHHASHFSEIVAGTPEAAWSNASPCEGWTALDVVVHVVTTEADFLGRIPGTEPLALDAEWERDFQQVAAAWAATRDQMQRVLDDPARASAEYDGYFGRTTFEATIEKFYVSDLVVHAWDVAAATGRVDDYRIDPSEMVRYREDFASMADMMRQPGILGPEVEPVRGDDQSLFLAWLGRRWP